MANKKQKTLNLKEVKGSVKKRKEVKLDNQVETPLEKLKKPELVKMYRDLLATNVALDNENTGLVADNAKLLTNDEQTNTIIKDQNEVIIALKTDLKNNLNSLNQMTNNRDSVKGELKLADSAIRVSSDKCNDLINELEEYKTMSIFEFIKYKLTK